MVDRSYIAAVYTGGSRSARAGDGFDSYVQAAAQQLEGYEQDIQDLMELWSQKRSR